MSKLQELEDRIRVIELRLNENDRALGETVDSIVDSLFRNGDPNIAAITSDEDVASMKVKSPSG